MARTKKVVITAFGDESKLAIVESDLNDPAAGEVQLSVEYTIVSGSDVNMRRGTYPLQKKPPLTPGYSVIGKVRLNGPGSANFGIGDCVACLSKYEGQSELINLPEQFLVGVPEALDKKAAVVLSHPGLGHRVSNAAPGSACHRWPEDLRSCVERRRGRRAPTARKTTRSPGLWYSFIEKARRTATTRSNPSRLLE